MGQVAFFHGKLPNGTKILLRNPDAMHIQKDIRAFDSLCHPFLLGKNFPQCRPKLYHPVALVRFEVFLFLVAHPA